VSDAQVDQLIGKLEAKHESTPYLQASFREERHLAALKEPDVKQGKIWFVPPDKIRREITGAQPSTTVINGDQMWIYYPKFNDVEKYDISKRPELRDSVQAITAGLNFQKVRSLYNVTASSEGDGYRINLVPRTGAAKKVVKALTLTLDADLIPRRVDFESPRGEQVTVSYSNVRREEIPDSTFEFTPPPGATVTTPLGS
jgi:outer membrane lipoprotein-sorting protein